MTVPQLSTPERPGAARIEDDAGSPASALRRAGAAVAPAQLGESRRSVEVASSPSTAAEGRAVAKSTAVGGRDRCDPALATSDSEACQRRLETRAGEFPTPTPAPVTAEGRLLLLTQPQGSPAEIAARRADGRGLENLTGSAAGQLAGAIMAGRATAPSTPADPAPPSVSATIVITPR